MTNSNSKGDSKSEERRRDPRVPLRQPIQYYFAHAVELVNTKVYRTGVTHDVSEYGLKFEAEVLDPTIIPLALLGDVFVDVKVVPPDHPPFKARGKVVWCSPLDEANGMYLLGIQYVVADQSERANFWRYANGQPVS